MKRDIITALVSNFLRTTYFVLCFSAELWFILRSKTLRVQLATFKMLIHLDKCIVKTSPENISVSKEISYSSE
jgi:hypothetical protein